MGKAIGWRSWSLLLALLVAGSSVASGFFRVRSRLLALDIVMVPVFGLSVPLALARSGELGAAEVVVGAGMPWLVRGAVLVLLAASAIQVCVGRLDLPRGRLWLSGITWSGLLSLVAGGILGFGYYIAAEPPTELRFPWVEAPPVGRHVLLTGVSGRWEHHNVAYVLDERARARALGGLGVSGWAWSRDGRRLAVTSSGLSNEESGVRLPSLLGLGPAVTVHDLESPGRHSERFDLQEWGTAVDFSSSGQRLLLLGHEHRVIDTTTGAELASLQDPLQWQQAAFVSETAVRALRAVEGQVTQVVEWDLGSGRLTERGSTDVQGSALSTLLKPVESWQKLLRLDRRGLSLLDLDGSVIAELADGGPASARRVAGPLSAGRYWLVEEEDSDLRFRVFEDDGAVACDARLPGQFPIRVGGEPAPNILAIVVTPRREPGRGVTLLVDLETGGIQRREAGVYPIDAGWGPFAFFGGVYPETGSRATRLFLGDDGLVLLDPATGARTILVRWSRLTER